MFENKRFGKVIFAFLLMFSVVFVTAVCDTGDGVPTKNIGQVLCTIKEQSFRGLGNLLVSFAYISGIGLLIAAVFKLKQVKDNPTQIPVSTPAALFLCGTLSMFLPSIFAPAGQTMFGSSAKSTDAVGGDVAESGITNFIGGSS